MSGTAVIPQAQGGHGRLTWDANPHVHNHYRIRRGHILRAGITFGTGTDESLYPQILDGICAVLDQHEGEPQP